MFTKRKIIIGGIIATAVVIITTIVIIKSTSSKPQIVYTTVEREDPKPGDVKTKSTDDSGSKIMSPDEINDVIESSKALKGALTLKDDIDRPSTIMEGNVKSLFGEDGATGCTVTQGNDNSATFNCGGSTATIYGAVGPPGLNGRDGVCSAETIKEAAKGTNLSVSGLEVTGTDGLYVKGNIKTEGDLTANGTSFLDGGVETTTLTTSGDANVAGDSTVGGVLNVNGTGYTNIKGTLKVDDNIELKDVLKFTSPEGNTIRNGDQVIMKYDPNFSTPIQFHRPVGIGWNGDNSQQLTVDGTTTTNQAKIGDLTIRNDVIERGDDGQIHFSSNGNIRLKVGGADKRGDPNYNVSAVSGGYGSAIELGDNLQIKNHPDYKGYLTDAIKGNVRDKLPFLYNGGTGKDDDHGKFHNIADFSDYTYWRDVKNNDKLRSENINWGDDNMDAISIPPRTKVLITTGTDFGGDRQEFKNESYKDWQAFKFNDKLVNRNTSMEVTKI